MSTETPETDVIDYGTKLFKFWNLEKKENNKAELMLYGDIVERTYWTEEAISAMDVIRDLKALDVEEIIVHINSNGGGVTSAVAIANTLKQHKAKVTCYIDGIVASAATIITSACDTVKMPNNAIFMVHNPWTIAMGDSKDLNKTAETLDKIKSTIINTYIDKTGLEESVLSELMDNETYMTAKEALEYGFIDEIIENTDVQIVENKVISNGLAFNMLNISNFINRKKENEGVKTDVKSNIKDINQKVNDVMKNIINKGSEKMTREELKEKFPEVYNSIFEEGKELGRTEGVTEGIKNERARIKEIEDLGYTGEIVDKAKFEEPRNVNELAVEILKAQKKETEAKIENLKNENKPLNTLPKTEVPADKDLEEAQKILALMNGGK